MHIGRLAARAVIGSLFIGHGTQKLFGSFGGPGLEGTDGMMQALSMHPPRRNSLAAGWAETAGGALVVAGLATPLAASLLTANMVTAIRKVHFSNGPWAANGGWEYNGVLIAALTALVETGPGDLSLDAVVAKRLHGPGWALTALFTGITASTVAIEVGRRSAPAGGSGPAPDTAGDPVTRD
jgi:putative oxidoreductase